MSSSDTMPFGWGLARKLSVIRQNEVAECGNACLAMVAGYYGFATDLGALRRRFPVTSRGQTLRTLAENAGRLGLAPRALKCNVGNLAQLRLPAILHWDLNHFVVLKAISRTKAEIHDPARGAVSLSLDELGKHFTGVVLELTPTGDFEKTDERTRLRFSSLWSQLSGLTGSLVQVAIFSLVVQAYVIAAPQYLQTVIDTVLPSLDADLLLILALGFGLFLIFNTVASVLRQLVILYAGSSMAYQVAANLFNRLIRLPLPFFERRHIGDVVSRFTSIGPIKDFLTQGLVTSLIDGAMALITLGLMLLYSPVLAAITGGATLIYLAFRLAMLRRFRQASESGIFAQAEENTNFIETVRGILPVKAFAQEESRRLRWQNLLAETVNTAVRVERQRISFDAGRGFIFEAEKILVVLIAARMAMEAEFTVGMIFAYMAYRTQFVDNTSSLVETVIEFRMLQLHLDRISDIALAEPERDGGVALDISDGRIDVRDVSFAYQEGQRPILTQVDLSVAPGECVALIGASGGGKTTLLKIMMGLLEPQSGEVLVDGVSLAHADQSRFRQQIASVMQNDMLFSGSIADNITFFDLDPDVASMEDCARRASVHDDIMAMAMGYETPVGDMGAALSGGQLQRLLLARALYRAPRILFVDEGTSNLDIETERLVNMSLAALGITRVIVAHRPETIKTADRVLLVENGEVSEVT